MNLEEFSSMAALSPQHMVHVSPEREVGCIGDDVSSQKEHSTEDLGSACSVSFEEPFIYSIL